MKVVQLKHESKRSRMDVISCILEKSNQRANETRLLHMCDLSPSQLNPYRKFLVESGLLEVSGQEQDVDIFETTEKGRDFLRDYARVKALFSIGSKRQKRR